MPSGLRSVNTARKLSAFLGANSTYSGSSSTPCGDRWKSSAKTTPRVRCPRARTVRWMRRRTRAHGADWQCTCPTRTHTSTRAHAHPDAHAHAHTHAHLPLGRVGRAQQANDEGQLGQHRRGLVLAALRWEQRHPKDQLREHAPHAPDVHLLAVVGGAEQQLWGPVPAEGAGWGGGGGRGEGSAEAHAQGPTCPDTRPSTRLVGQGQKDTCKKAAKHSTLHHVGAGGTHRHPPNAGMHAHTRASHTHTPNTTSVGWWRGGRTPNKAHSRGASGERMHGGGETG